ncbi:MAG: hypothetical protein K6G00_00050 [Treponema sp.]|nr:hypothetical protein [Treponema sp.]
MKCFSKVAAILAALMLACAFIACSNDTSDDKTVVATFSNSQTITETSTVYTFYSDNTVSIKDVEGTETHTYSGSPEATSGTVTIGSYTITINGDTASDGSQTLYRQ